MIENCDNNLQVKVKHAFQGKPSKLVQDLSVIFQHHGIIMFKCGWENLTCHRIFQNQVSENYKEVKSTGQNLLLKSKTVHLS